MTLTQLCGKLCNDADFLMWLDWNRKQKVGTSTPEAAKLFFYKACEMDSRKQLTEDGFDRSRKMFALIRTTYLKDMREIRASGNFKQPRYENAFYISWVKTLACVASKMPADDPHHLIGHGQGKMGGKASDLFTFPLTREQHTALHDDPVAWERQYGSQWAHVAKTMEIAVREGVLTVNG
ncbi:MAG: DUF968 domain-containing protein [Pseudomonadales bacterium]